MPSLPTTPGSFQLGEWIVFPRRHAVEPAEGPCEAEGLGQKVSAKAMAVLVHLASRPGQVVGKEELIDAVWPGAYTSDEALSTVIYELRRTLGDRASAPRYIETIRKSGYRLLPEPLPRTPADTTPALPSDPSASQPAALGAEQDVQDPHPPIPPETVHLDAPPGQGGQAPRILGTGILRTMIPGALVLGIVALGFLFPTGWSRFSLEPREIQSGSIDSLAVLPLAAYLAEDRHLLDTALTDMLIGDIARVCAVDVAPGIALSRESGSWSLEEALDALGVDAVVEGAVARSGDNLWISLQLVDLRTGRMLWNATYDRQLGDELLVLREVTQDAALRIRDELARHPVWQELPDPISATEPSFDLEAPEN